MLSLFEMVVKQTIPFAFHPERSRGIKFSEYRLSLIHIKQSQFITMLSIVQTWYRNALLELAAYCSDKNISLWSYVVGNKIVDL